MMRHHYSTIDNKTGKELILSGCSYNFACSWLEDELDRAGYHVWTAVVEDPDDMVVIYTRDNKTGKEGRRYMYDEERGYLLGE